MSDQAARKTDTTATTRERLGNALDVAAFYAIVLIVAMRPLLSETFDAHVNTMGQIVASPGDLTPATTAWLDFGLWTAALAAGVAAWMQRRRWRLTGVEIGAGILVAAAILSTAVAGNQRLALNASFSWLTALVVVIAMANLCRDRMRIGLLLAALVASGFASMARCTMQHSIEYTETKQDYEKNREEFWARQGVPLDDPDVHLYELRLAAAEASGFFALSNTQGAWLSLAGFATLALRGLIVRRRRLAYALLLPAVLAFAMIFWTGSKGALVAAGLALAAWGALSFTLEEMRPRWRLALFSGWLLIAGVVSFGIMYGMAKGGLPGDSLRFRWNYWEVTRDIISQHGMTGVGALNFDSAYLAHKPVQYPEEIKDPHNFVLSIVAQWGVLGGIGLLAVLAGGSIVMARTWGRREPTDTPPPVYDPQARYLGLQWIVAIAMGFFLLRLWLMRGWLGDPSGTAYVFFDMGLYGLVWLVGFAGLSWLTRGGWAGDLDYCQLACLAGVCAFMLHNLIDVAMLYPGTLLPFAAMAAVLVVAGPDNRAVPVRTAPAWVPTAAVAAGVVAGLVLVLVPVTRTNRLLGEARFGHWPPDETLALYEQAVEADPLDPVPPAEMARYLVQRWNGPALPQAVAAIGEAIARSPRQVGLYRTRAGLLEASYRQSGSMADLIGAIGAARRVELLYPNSPDDHLWAADLLARAAASAADEGEGLLAEAINHYEKALALDAARAQGEIRRWRPAKREAVAERLQLLLDAVSAAAADDVTTNDAAMRPATPTTATPTTATPTTATQPTATQPTKPPTASTP